MTVHPITTEFQQSELAAVMDAGTHSCFSPTHILRDDQGKIAGAFSTTCAPVLFFWIDSRLHNPIASAHAYALAEEEFKRLGHDRILLHLERSSPFYCYLERIGYTILGDATLFTKELAK